MTEEQREIHSNQAYMCSALISSYDAIMRMNQFNSTPFERSKLHTNKKKIAER